MLNRLLIFLLLALPVAAQQCTKACLMDAMGQYVEAMLAHDASKLTLAAPDLKATENGKRVKLGEGIWQTARFTPFRQTVADPQNGQVALFGVVTEGEANEQAILFIRLRVAGKQITEAETLVARKGAHPAFRPDLMGKNPVWSTVLPEDERVSREQLIAATDAYFTGIEDNSAAKIPFHPECQRVENGVQTTNNPERGSPSCVAGMPRFTYITKVRDRRYPIVDVERGITVGIVVFDVPGEGAQAAKPLARNKRNLFLYEVFKIESGRIRNIEAFMTNMPFDSAIGW
jgi:hypothetical protein